MTGSLPSVSVVIPALRGGDALIHAVESVERQTFGEISEIVIASPNDMPSELEDRVTWIDNPTGTTPEGLNRGIAASTGEVIVRCDAHAILPPSYVASAVNTLVSTGAANVGGMQVPVGTGFWSSAIAAAMSSPLGAGDARYRVGGTPGPAETVYLGTFNRQDLDEVGGFDPEFVRNQDFELNHRLIQAGKTVWFDPELQVTYRPRNSLRALARQYFDFGRGKRRFARVHPGQLLVRQMAPTALVIALASSVLLGLVWRPMWLVPAGYVIGLVAGGLATIPKAGLAAAGVPLALATMHISWGLGFIRG
ncbi:MAG: glycosyltransferase [Acidimicrobiia bacterium]